MITPTTPPATAPPAAGAVSPAGAPAGPAWLPSPGTLDRLRRRRARRRLTEAIAGGHWRRVLIDWANTQHRYKRLARTGGEIDTFLVSFNVVGQCAAFLGDIIANRAPTFSVSAINPDQSRAIDDITGRCLFDARFREAVHKTIVESEAVLRADVGPGGAVVCVEDNNVAFPVGDPGPDGQPSVLERRWTVTRESGRERRSYLHVERYRHDGDWVVEREAYRFTSAPATDVLVGLETLEPVTLDTAGAAPGAEPRRKMPVTSAPFVHLVRGLSDGEPIPSVRPSSLDLFDAMAAAVTRLARTMELHGDAKYRVPESAVDPETNSVKSFEAVVDPDKEYEAIVSAFDFKALLDTAELFARHVCVDMSVSPSLLGHKFSGVSAADTAEKIELEAKPTIASAERSRPYMQDALGRIMRAATEIEAEASHGFFRVDGVSARLHIGLPKSSDETEREAMNRADRGYDSRLNALRAIHGEENAQRVLEEIRAEEADKDARQRAAGFGAFGLDTLAAEPAAGPEPAAVPAAGPAVPGADGGDA